MFLQRMALLIFILTLAACLQAENSNTLDASNYGDNGGGILNLSLPKPFSRRTAQAAMFTTITRRPRHS